MLLRWRLPVLHSHSRMFHCRPLRGRLEEKTPLCSSGMSHGIPRKLMPLQAPNPCALMTWATVRAGELAATEGG